KQQQRIGLPQRVERIEVIKACGLFVNQMLDAKLPRMREYARREVGCLIAGAEEVEAQAIGQTGIALEQRTCSGQHRPQGADAEGQQRPRVTDVDAPLAGNQVRMRATM